MLQNNLETNFEVGKTQRSQTPEVKQFIGFLYFTQCYYCTLMQPKEFCYFRFFEQLHHPTHTGNRFFHFIVFALSLFLLPRQLWDLRRCADRFDGVEYLKIRVLFQAGLWIQINPYPHSFSLLDPDPHIECRPGFRREIF